MTIQATYLGSSGWFLSFGKINVLIDPWLVGKLVFPPGPWLIEGTLKKDLEVPSHVNIILLTQGLADHSHIPSLKLLPRSIPVIGSSSAVQVVKSLGFHDVKELKPGTQTLIQGLNVKATTGAPVPKVENGYLLSNQEGSIYIEPHGFLDPTIESRELDAVITPVIDLKLPVFGSFIKGKSVLPELIDRFKPLQIFASTTGGDATFKGILNKLIYTEGNLEVAAEIIGNKSKFYDPSPGKTYQLDVR